MIALVMFFLCASYTMLCLCAAAKSGDERAAEALRGMGIANRQ